MKDLPSSDQKKPLFSSSDLRIIAISLSILSLGLAIAWIGFILLTSGK